jgi:hypothetical protein
VLQDKARQIMANGMTVTVTDEADSTNQLKSIFDQSLAVLCEGEDTVKTGSQTERLRRRSMPLRVDAVNLQKRALDNAAKALATLWKISEPKRTKLQSPATHYSRSSS